MKKPMVILLMGVKRIPARLNAGYMTRSKIGIRIMRAKGSRFPITSFGKPWVCMVAACEVKLLLIWL